MPVLLAAPPDTPDELDFTLTALGHEEIAMEQEPDRTDRVSAAYKGAFADCRARYPIVGSIAFDGLLGFGAVLLDRDAVEQPAKEPTIG